MHPCYVAPGTVPAPAPVWFVTAATYAEVRERQGAQERAFADAAGFEPKAGRHLLLPGRDGAPLGVLFGLGAANEPDLFLPGRLPGLAAGRHLPLRQRAPRCAARGARVRARRLSFRPLPQGRGQGGRARAAGRRRRRRSLPHRRGCLARARSHQHAGERPRAGGARRRRARARLAPRRELPRDRRRRPPHGELSPHPCGRPRRRPRAAADRHRLGRSGGTRRSRSSARACASTPAGSTSSPSSGMLNMKKDMGGAACVLALAHMVMDRGLKVRLRVLIPAVENAISGNAFRPARRLPLAQGADRRDRQHRRGRAADPRRCARARRRGGARPHRRHGDADRRRARRARARSAAVLYRRRRAGRRA